MTENWLPVVGHEGYEVSDHGRVRGPKGLRPTYSKSHRPVQLELRDHRDELLCRVDELREERDELKAELNRALTAAQAYQHRLAQK